ncbi:MAG: VTC domain-containing protein [Planctomycetaceae bacterium]|nr:VTC domain-containing protein [Planctomycetaceae bacterium]
MIQQNSEQSIKNALSRMTPIDLAGLDRVALMNRVDTKYVLNDAELPGVLDRISPDYGVLEVEGLRCSPYATLYFDTPNDDCYRDHHNGKGQRFKYRMRSYLASDTSFFEVKRRTNKGRTVKSRVVVPAIRSALDDRVREFADSTTGEPICLESAVWTQFSRITLAGWDVKERVTIDVDLSFEQEGRSVALPGVAIVEVKQERNSRESPIRQALRAIRVSPMRISKYCIGRAMLDPTLKSNRFKRKLLALRNITCM